jgi:hypothetical protein
MSDVYEILQHDSGKFTMEQLYRNLHVEELGFKFEYFNILVIDNMIHGFIVISNEDKLWLRSKLHQPPQAQQKQM